MDNTYQPYQPYNANPNQGLLDQISPKSPTVQAQPADTGNWFTHLLPMLGSIALPTIGALLAPETGGLSLLGGIAGGAALSGIGGAGGKVIENMAENKAPIDQNVATEGITNAVAGGVGGAIGKGLSTLSKNVIAPAAGNFSEKLIAGQAAKGQLGKDTAVALRGMGTTNLSEAQRIAALASGKTGAINQGTLRAVGEAADNGAVSDLSNLSHVANTLVADNAMQLNPGSVEQINQKLQQSLIDAVHPSSVIKIPGGKGSVVTNIENGALANALPEKALAVSKSYGKLADAAYNSAYDKAGNVVNGDQAAKYQIFKGLRNETQARAFENAPVTDLNKAQIIADLEPVKAVNPAVHANLVEQVNQAKVGSDLRSMQAPLVQASKAVQATERLGSINGGTTIANEVGNITPTIGGYALGGPGAAVAGYVGSKALQSPVSGRIGASLANKVSGIAGSDKAAKIIPLLSRIGAVTTANLPTMGAGPSSGAGQPQLGINGGTGSMDMNGTPAVGQDQNQYSGLINAMIAQSILAPNMAGNSGATSLLQSVAPQLQAKQELGGMLGGMQNSYNNAGGAQGFGGIGSMLSSFVPGTAANAYQSQQQTVAAEIAKALGISPEAAMNVLPQLMQDPGTANVRMGTLQSMLSNLAG